MLDRIASAIERPLQSDAVVGVARHFLSPSVRFVHDRLQLFHRQRRLRHQLSFLVHPRPVRHVHLDPVRAVLELLARSLARFHRAVHDLHALGHLQFRRVAFQVVAARRRDRSRCAKQSRPGDRPFFNGLLDFHVAVSRAFGFHVAQRGESLFQSAPHRNRGARGA